MAKEPKREDKDARETGEKNLWDKIKGYSRAFDEFLREHRLDNIGILRRWDKIKGYLLDNPTLALTLLYLYVTAIGMFYSAVLYGSFGINIFDYSEIPDFLLAAFKAPAAFVFAGLQFSLLPAAFRLFRANMNSEIPVGPTGILAVLVSSSFSVIFIFASFDAEYVAGSIELGENQAVEVQYRSFSGSAGQVTVSGLQFIGGTQRAAFFYDPDAERTIVIPQTQIVSIEVPQ